MKIKLYVILILFVVAFSVQTGFAQGCVAVRNISSCSLTSEDEPGKSWQFSLNYRYFRSYKHFRGKHEEKNRVEDGTEVINNDNSILLGVNYSINKKWSVAAVVPFIFVDRSSLYEHYGNPTEENPALNPRFHTQSSGIGDVRLTGYYNAVRKGKFQLSLGLGVKLPTGNYQVKDDFHKKDSQGGDSLVYKVVDQSIQLGDGGFGFTLEFNTFYKFASNFGVYGNGSYLFNPRNTNGIKRSPTLTSNIPLSNEFSVADQFMFRAGAQYMIKRFSLSLGGRYEGVASTDIIGDSDGFRRPGYIISIEPSAGYRKGKHSIDINFPVALERNRTRNSIDKERTKLSGTYTIGDAAFADWLVSISYVYHLTK